MEAEDLSLKKMNSLFSKLYSSSNKKLPEKKKSAKQLSSADVIDSYTADEESDSRDTVSDYEHEHNPEFYEVDSDDYGNGSNSDTDEKSIPLCGQDARKVLNNGCCSKKFCHKNNLLINKKRTDAEIKSYIYEQTLMELEVTHNYYSSMYVILIVMIYK